MKIFITIAFSFLFAGTILLQSCRKDNGFGNLEHKLKYTTVKIGLKVKANDSTYAGFGDYITSLTPYVFKSKLNILSYQDDFDPTNNKTHIISYVDGHDNNPAYEIALYADFSNNQEIAATPILYNDLMDGVFNKKQLTFTYFNFSPDYLYQEVELLAQYENVIINQFNEQYDEPYYCDSVKFGTVLKIKHVPFITRLFPYGNGYPWDYVFGNTDSSFIFNKEGNTIYTSVNWPMGGSTQKPIVRSNNYVPKVIEMPANNETLQMVSTISFDTENLIQVYAGLDNIPYTSDDIFLYAPKYWERIKVKLDVNTY